MNETSAAPTSANTPASTPTAPFITEAVFNAVLGDVYERLRIADANIATLAAEVADLRSA
jgi:hypothetical protein